MDSIHIRQLSLSCKIGVTARERRRQQTVILNVSLHGDFLAAAQRDRLEDALDYISMRESIAKLVQNSRFHLLEALAQAVAQLCLAEPRVAAVDVLLEKPLASAGPTRLAVEIRRTRPAAGAAAPA